MTGVGGQGTLTATTLLARVAVAQGVEVVAGEIHGMAQRGGVVESTILLGGWKSPKLGFGEADIVLGFEPLETLRGLRYLKQGGVVFSSTDVIPPLSVSAGREVAPGLDAVEQAVRDRASSAWFLPCRSMGIELGSAQCGNNILLGALCASGLLPFGFEAISANAPRILRMPFLWMRRADCSVFLFALMHPIAHKGLETGLSAGPFFDSYV